MRSSRCLFSAATALHRVFIAPIEQSHVRIIPRNALWPQSTFNTHRVLATQRRSLVNLHRAEKSRLPRDDEIQSWSVTLVDDRGRLQPPRSTMAILESMDRKKDSLVVVKMGEPGIPPVCKIMNKLAMREAEKARRKSEKKGGVTVKNIELNWAIDGNDLAHRLNKMKEFLQKGQRVEVVCAVKKKGRKATYDESQALLKKITEAMNEVGAREMKPMEGKIGAMLTVFLEGKISKTAAVAVETGAPTERPIEEKTEASARTLRKRWADNEPKDEVSEEA